jgi:hypothetical protein
MLVDLSSVAVQSYWLSNLVNLGSVEVGRVLCHSDVGPVTAVTALSATVTIRLFVSGIVIIVDAILQSTCLYQSRPFWPYTISCIDRNL